MDKTIAGFSGTLPPHRSLGLGNVITRFTIGCANCFCALRVIKHCLTSPQCHWTRVWSAFNAIEHLAHRNIYCMWNIFVKNPFMYVCYVAKKPQSSIFESEYYGEYEKKCNIYHFLSLHFVRWWRQMHWPGSAAATEHEEQITVTRTGNKLHRE